MDNNVNKKLEEILSSVDKATLQKSTQRAVDMLGTAEGQKLRNSLAGADKQKLMKLFSQLDAKKVKSALENADSSGLVGMSAEEIIKKLNQL